MINARELGPMSLLNENIDLFGAIITNVNNVLLISIFIARIYHRQPAEHCLGKIFIFSMIPLLWMFCQAFEMDRPFLYFLQLGLMLIFIVMELILDYILKLDFRHNQKFVIPYVTLFYASTGGMIGIASHSGHDWMIISVVSFLTMVIVSLFMHYRTGE